MLIRNFSIVYIVTLLIFGLPARSEEWVTREQIQRQVIDLYLASDFSGLEELAENFRRTDERTSSGLRKLNLFYFSLSIAISEFTENNDGWDFALNRADEWVSTYPNSATAAIAKATTLEKHAEQVLGLAYSESANTKAWVTFFRRLSKTDDYLMQIQEVASSDPFWYYKRAHIMKRLGVGPEEFLPFAQSALERHPDDYQLYFAIADYFSPNSYGDAEVIESFARAAVELTKSSEGKAMYARIYWYLSQTEFGFSLFKESNVVWPDMRDGFVDILARYSDQWNIQNFAVFACLANDVEMTRKLIAQMEGRPIMMAWHKMGMVDHCFSLAESR